MTDDYRCGIHATLRADGFKGCTVFDCHGAGQKVTQAVFAGRSWREDETTRAAMFAVFPIVRKLQEMLWYLHTAKSFTEAAPQAGSLDALYRRVEALSESSPEQLLALSMDTVRDQVNETLSVVSVAVRSAASVARTTALPGSIRTGADLVGAHLAGLDLRGADLRGALLLAADLSTANLCGADLLAADLRDANLCDADLSSSLFVTQMQINAAMGNSGTQLPATVVIPTHWV